MVVIASRQQWVDADGNTRITQLLGNASTLTVRLQLLNMSEADELTDFEGNLTVNTTPAPPGGTFRSVADEARLLYSDASGFLVQVTLPAPQASLFLADGETVDPANVNLAALNAAVIGVVLTAAGNPTTNYVGGYRARRIGGS